MGKMTYSVQYNDVDATARLAHYNAWLLDPNREMGTTYPGYPADQEGADKVKRVRKIAADVVVNEMAKKTRAASTKKSTGKVTNRERVAALIRDLPYNTKAEKELVIGKIVDLLGVTKSNAAVYAYNAKRM